MEMTAEEHTPFPALGLPRHVGSGFIARKLFHMNPTITPCVAGNPHKSASTNATYVSFGARGDKLLATYHADHAYAFDITKSAEGAHAASYPSPPSDVAQPEPQRQPLMTSPGYMPDVQPTDLSR